MIYGKLPVVFLSTIASEKHDSTNHAIASWILEHVDEVRGMGIRDLAASCHVGTGSISRFCKEIGLEDFAELKEMLQTSDFYFEACSDRETMQGRMMDYGNKVKQSIDMVTKSISTRMLTILCEDLAAYPNIAAFGLLKAETAALNLQSDLLMLGRKIDTHMSYAEQLQYIQSCGSDTLILIFSYTGSYFEYQKEKLKWDEKNHPKIWMIAGKKPEKNPYVDKVLEFRSMQDQSSHPYQLQYTASLIAQEYARLNLKKDFETET